MNKTIVSVLFLALSASTAQAGVFDFLKRDAPPKTRCTIDNPVVGCGERMGGESPRSSTKSTPDPEPDCPDDNTGDNGNSDGVGDGNSGNGAGNGGGNGTGNEGGGNGPTK